MMPELTRSTGTCVCFFYNSFKSLREFKTLSMAISLPNTSDYGVYLLIQQMNAGGHDWNRKAGKPMELQSSCLVNRTNAVPGVT